MISFNSLGYMGRLGNQMFQYAALMGIATKHNYEFIIPPPTGDRSLTGQFKVDHLLLEAFKLTSLKYVGWTRFNKTIFENDPIEDNVDLKGYYQSEKYFKHIKNDIIKEYEFHPIIEDKAKAEVDPNSIALHVRRTDYLETESPMKMCLKDYYDTALNNFDSNQPVLIFSDDIDWCKINFYGSRFYFSENNSNILDMCRMTHCKDYIISNSSFSWWGAYLSKNVNKKVIAPQKWFKNTVKNDIIPIEWMSI